MPEESIAQTVDKIRADAAKDERERLWNALRDHWHGDMGPAYVYVREIEPLFKP